MLFRSPPRDRRGDSAQQEYFHLDGAFTQSNQINIKHVLIHDMKTGVLKYRLTTLIIFSTLTIMLPGMTEGDSEQGSTLVVVI